MKILPPILILIFCFSVFGQKKPLKNYCSSERFCFEKDTFMKKWHAGEPIIRDVQLRSLGEKQIEALKKVLALTPDDFSANGILGSAYNKVNNYTEAIKYFKEAVRLNPDNALGYASIGDDYYRLGDYNQGIEFFKQAQVHDPEDAHIQLYLGQGYLEIKQPEVAIKTLTLLITHSPDLHEAYFYLGRAYLAVKDKAKAQEQYNKLKETEPEMAANLLQLIDK